MTFAEIFFDVGPLSIFLFLIGIGLFVAEMFNPGFGIMGFSGIAILIVDIIITARSIRHGLILGGGVLVLLTALFFAFVVFVARGKLPKTLVLSESLSEQGGYSSAPSFSELVGKEGIAETALRPSGIAEFEGKKYDVVSEGEFVESGQAVMVDAVYGNRIVIKRKR